MSILCDQLRKILNDRKREQQEINAARAIKDLGLDTSKFSASRPKDIIDHMVNNLGLDKDTVMAEMNNPNTKEGRFAKMQANEKLADKAMSVAAKLQQPGGVRDAWDTVRARVKEFAEKAINTMPQALSAQAKAFAKKIVSLRSSVDCGTDANGNKVYAGANTYHEIVGEIENLAKTVGMKFGDLDKGLNMLGYMRGMDIPSTIASARKTIESKIKDNPILKNVIPLLDQAEAAYKHQEVRDYMDKYFNKLDIIAKTLKDSGALKDHKLEDGTVIKADLDNYYHNNVAMEHYRDPWEKLFYGDSFNMSNVAESKKYKNGLEYMLSGKGLPASFNFTDNAGQYHKNVASSLRIRTIGEIMRGDAGMDAGSADKMTITGMGGKQEALFVTRPVVGEWEVPKTAKGEAYRNMSGINDQFFHDIYVHPEMYEWLNQSFGRAPKINGAFLAFKRTQDMFKQVLLSAGRGIFSYHGMSLARKAMEAGGTMGVEGWWQLKSIQGEGLSAVANHDADFLRLQEHGMTIHTTDMLRNPLMTSQFDLKTGNKTVTATLADMVNQYSNWQHKELFGKVQLGIKVGLAKRAIQTPWFKEMVDRNGPDAAYETLAKIMNDAMGGQNLELMGRNKGIQSIVSSLFLAPDWQESKFRRLLGTVMADTPELRRAYQLQMGAELIAVTMATVVGQTVWGEISGNRRDIDQIARDMMEGKIGMLHIGKSSDGKDIWLRGFGSEIEDIKPPLKIVKAYYEAITGHDYEGRKSDYAKLSAIQKFYRPAVEEIMSEGRNKLAPLTKYMVDAMNREKQSGKPSAFDFPLLPIAIQQNIYAARGGFGLTEDERAKYMALTLATSWLGTPLETSKEKKGKKVAKPLSFFK